MGDEQIRMSSRIKQIFPQPVTDSNDSQSLRTGTKSPSGDFVKD